MIVWVMYDAVMPAERDMRPLRPPSLLVVVDYASRVVGLASRLREEPPELIEIADVDRARLLAHVEEVDVVVDP